MSHPKTCAASAVGSVKCFGSNSQGQLGYNHTDNIGDRDDEMGDYLDFVDLGTGFNFSHFAVGSYGGTTCVVSTENDIRCWGLNEYGTWFLSTEYRRYFALNDCENR